MLVIAGTDDGWVPAYLSGRLDRGAVIQTYIDGQDIAVWRSHLGKVNAWSNRCPHRGMRLSHGFVRGEMLACIYHGWHYGDDGVCKYIPAHGDLVPPKSICANTFECVEQDGLIWINSGEADRRPADHGSLYPIRTITFSVGLNALDPEELERSVSLQDSDPESSLVFAFQEVGVNETNIHVLSTKPISIETKKYLSRKLDQFRDEIEMKAVDI